MKKILLSLIYCFSFQFILNRKRIIKKIEIFLLLNSCLIATGYSQALDLSYGLEGWAAVTQPNDFYLDVSTDRGSESGAMALQKDGKLLIAYGGVANPTSNRGFALIRLNPDGSSDQTFSNDGNAFAEIFSFSSRLIPTDISLAPDGKIVVTGSGFVTRAGINYYAFIASCFNTDGTPDNSFDGDGTLILNESVIFKGTTSVAIQPDGKILLAGSENDPLRESHYKAVRLNTNGTLDNSFGIGGIVIGPEALSGAGKIRLQPDGKIVVAGYIQNRFDRNIYNSLVVRLNANGSFDSGFGINGKTIVEFGYPNSISSIAFQSDGKILVAGASNKPDDNPDGDDSDYIIARLNQNGTLDNSFDEDGKKVIDFYKSNDRWSSVAVRSDGLIFLNGEAAGQFGIVCLNEDGSCNESFDRDGKLLLSFVLAEGAKGYDILVQGDGKILVSGISDGPAIARFVFDNSINSFPPLLDSIGLKSVNELEELRFTAKATDKDTPANLLKYSLAKPISGDLPRGARIDATTGLFSWTPTEEQGGSTYFLTIVVSDGSNTDDEVFRIDVQEVVEPSFPPSLDSIESQSVNEREQLKFTATATDKDSPASKLKFTLAKAATGKFPEGATIDKSSGLFCWTPTEAQGPGTYRVRIVVSDGECTDEEEIEIKVGEVNAKPVLSKIGDHKVNDRRLLTFKVKATDKDIPENTLTFSLANPSAGIFPTGASINASTGTFNWLPAKTQMPGTFRVKVIVSDGIATDEEEFAIHVFTTGSASLVAFPNPSAQHAIVRFAVPANEALVSLVLYDYKGMQINRLYEGRAEANRLYSFDVDGSRLSPGVYLIRLSMSQKAETFKMIITE